MLHEKYEEELIMKTNLIRKEIQFCPLCEKEHEVELRKEKRPFTYKGTKIVVDKIFYLCKEYKGYDWSTTEFCTQEMAKQNTDNINAAYLEKINKVLS